MEHEAIESKYIEGGCYCGMVKYQVQLPVKWCAHCHCTQCRHTHAAPLVTWFGVVNHQFQYLKGENDIIWFDSSKEAKRGHCINCGTPLFFIGEKWKDEVHITRESTQADILQKPQLHVFYDRHVDYLALEDKLDKFGGQDGFTLMSKNEDDSSEAEQP